ncbi:MAG TPA: hemolysin family protein [Thermoanaerobaculia bacterium]|nr:hemolysin family protein [Thermoanaerobaculia bacterium]
MGSSLSQGEWVAAAIVCGVLFLVCDAARFFAQQASQVTLRSWIADPENETRSRWVIYDPRNVQLMGGPLLQLLLIAAFGSTVMAFQPVSRGLSTGSALVLWLLIAAVWKFVLALVPEDIGEMILKRLIPVSHFFYIVFWPVVYPLRRMFARLEEQEEMEGEPEQVTEEEVQAFIDVGEEEGILEPSEGKMVHSVVEFGDRVARELMTPRIDVLAFNARGSLDELARLFAESKYSRIPIYQDSIDSITGIVHIKEVFEAILKKEPKAVAELARPPYFVSETKKVTELLREFQSEHLQVAVVVDEFGGTAGFITIEDIVEEIVGDIGDEHEAVEATIVDLGNDQWLVSGMLRVETLEEMLDAHFSGEDYETVAGMIFTTLGRVPKPGVTVAKNGYRFQVDRADRRRIYRVKISRDPEWQMQQEEQEA